MSYLISYEDHGKEPKHLGTANSLTTAKWFAAKQEGLQTSEVFWDKDDDGRVIFSLGDAQYTIEALKDIS